MAVNVISYVKNVGKSFGYAAIDVIGEQNKTIRGLVDTNKEFAVQIYETIKDFNGTKAKVMDKVVTNEYFGLAKEGVSNLLEDAASGKWYNKERKAQVDNELMSGMMGGDGFDFDDMDMDMDFNFDDDDMDMDFGSDDNDSGIDEETIDNVGSKVSTAIAQATAKSTEVIVSAQSQSTKILYEQQNKIFTQLQSGIGVVNSNLSVLSSLAQPLTSHMQNSAVFYTKSTEILEKQTSLLEQLVKNTTPKEEERKAKSSNKSTIDDFVDYEGVIDFKNYLGYVLGNVKESMSSLTGMADMFKDENGGGGNLLKAFIASPMEEVLKGVIKTIIPKTTQELTKSFNESIGGFFKTILLDISSGKMGGDNFFLNKLGEFMGINNSMKKNIDTSGYEKGKVDFDGVTRKSIVEVMPTYLSKILASLTGEEETRYDYSSGKFVKVSGIQKQLKYKLEKEATSNSYDLKWDMKDYMEAQGKTKADQEKLEKMLLNLSEKSIETGSRWNFRKEKSDYDIKKYGLDRESADFLASYFEYLNENNKGGLVTNFSGNIMSSRANIDKEMRSMEAEGDSILANIFNDSLGKDNKDINKIKSPLLSVKDEFDNNIFFYLQGIYEYTGHLSDNVGGNSSPAGRRGRKALKNATKGIRKLVAPIKEKLGEGTNDDLFEMSDDELSKLFKNAGIKYGEDSLEKFKDLDDEHKKKFVEGLNKKAYNKDKNGDGAIDKLVNANSIGGKIKVLMNGINTMMERPFKAVTDIISKADKTLFNILYGEEDDESEDKGFLGKALAGVKDMFSKMNTWLDDTILKPLQEKLKNFSFDKFLDKINEKLGIDVKGFFEKIIGKKDEDGKRSGGKLSGVINGVKDNFTGAKNWVKDAFGTVFKGKEGVGAVLSPDGTEAPTAANGGAVTKTGIIAVSEGELIIPSEKNPFYNKSVSKSKQKANEAKSALKFFGSYAEGGTVVDSDNKQNIQDVIDENIENNEQAKKVKGWIEYQFTEGIVRQSANELFSGVKNFTKEIFGSYKKKDKKQEETTNKVVETVLKEAKIPDNISGAITGAIIGVGGSILSGGLLSPLLATTLGAGAGFIIKSEKVQDALFGPEGIVPEDISKFITKDLPGIAKFGAVGSILSLVPGIPGGPVAGLIVGSAIGMAKENETVRIALFGDENKEGGFFSKKLQETVKERLPKIGAGALAGILAGPFGIVGNITVGGALGYLAGSEEFNNKIFGEKDEEGNRTGGLVQWIRDDLFAPVKNAIQPIGQEIKVQVKSLFKNFQKSIWNLFKEFIGLPLQKLIGDKIGKPLGALFSKLTSPIKAIIQAPFKAVGAVGDHFRKKQLQNNTASYMTAEERIKARDKFGLADSSFDTTLAGITDQEELSGIREKLKGISDPKKAAYKEAKNTLTGLSKSLSNMKEKDKDGNYANINAKDISSILKQVKKNPENVSEILKYIDNSSIPTVLKDRVRKLVSETAAEYSDNKKGISKGKSLVQSRLDELNAKFGLTGKDAITEDNAWKYEELIGKEASNLKIKADSLTVEEKINDAVTDIKENVSTMTATMVGTSSTTITSDGKVIKNIKDSNGNVIPDLSDSETKDYFENKEAVDNAQIEMAAGVETLNTGFSGFFGKFSNLFGGDKEDEEKESIFEKIFNFITGKGKINIGTVLATALSAIGVGTALTGGLDNIGSTVETTISKITGNEASNASGNQKYEMANAEGDAIDIMVDDNGNPVTDENGNYYTTDGQVIENSADAKVSSLSGDTFSGRLKKQITRSALGKTGSALFKKVAADSTGKAAKSAMNKATLSRVLGPKSIVENTKIGKAVEKYGGAAVKKGASKVSNSKLASKVTSKVDDVALKFAKSNIASSISTFCNSIKDVPLIGKIATYIDDFAVKLTAKASEGITKNAGKKAVKMLGSAVLVINIFTIATDFIDAMDDARNILRITAAPTISQRLWAALLSTLKNRIPIIGILVPDEVVMDLWIETVGPALGFDMSDLQEKRDQAKEEVEKFNQENGTSYTIEEYNNKYNKSIGQKVKDSVGKGVSKVKTKVSGAIGGAINNVKEGIATFGDKLESYREEGDTTSQALANMFDDTLPGSLGDVVASVLRMKDLMMQGDTKSIMNYKAEDTDDNSQMVNMMNRIILFPFKMGMGSISNIIGIGKSVTSFIGKFAKWGIDNYSKAKEGMSQLKEYAFNGDPASVINAQLTFEDGDPASGFQKMLFSLNKHGFAILGTIIGAGKWIGKTVGGFIDSIKDPILNVASNCMTIEGYALSGELGQMWNFEPKDLEDNPVSGVMKAVYGAIKILSLPRALMTTAIKTLAEKADKALGGDGNVSASETFSGIMNDNMDLFNIALSGKGDFWGKGSSIKGEGIAPALSNVLLGVTKPIMAMIYYPMKILNWVKEKGGEIGDSIKKFFAWDTDEEESGSGSKLSGSGSRLPLSGGSSFISQKDPSLANTRYSKSTFGAEGCGPAAATMAMSAAGINSNNINNNLNYARKNGYENSNGTSADYFGDVFSNNGLGAEYTASPDQLQRNIASGSPTVLLGQDPSNNSKKNSPFGPGNHYVVATGMDGAGNVIVQDPESRTPNKKYSSKILNKVKMGVSAINGSGSKINRFGKYRYYTGGSGEQSKNVWVFLKNKGCTDEAAAGIIGNLMQESGCDPTKIQGNGAGPAAGICQWENYNTKSKRWANLNKYAKEKGTEWTDLKTQLEFMWSELEGLDYYFKINTPLKNYKELMECKDLKEATKAFENAFERAGVKMMENRYKYAKEAYAKYSGKEVTADFDMDSDSTSGENGTGISSIPELISQLGSKAFGKVGELFGLTSSSGDSSSSSTSSGSPTGNDAQKKLVEVCKDKLGQLTYSMEGPRDPDKGSADCSSLVNWAYKKVTGVDVGGYTDAMLKSTKTEIVDQSDISKKNGGTNGSGPKLNKLQPGDILLYSRPNSSYNAGWDYRNGHVEMYMGDGKTIGHGGPDKGPTVKDISRGAGTYIMAKRLKTINEVSGSGSGLSLFDEGRSYSSRRYKGASNVRMYSGGESGVTSASQLVSERQRMIKSNANRASMYLSSGQSDAAVLMPLIKSIIVLLTTVTNNSDRLNDIVELLKQYLETGSTSSSNVVVNNDSTAAKQDNGVSELLNMLNEIAMG